MRTTKHLLLLALLLPVFLPVTLSAQDSPGNDYDPIADFYARYWAPPLGEMALRNLDSLLLPHLPADAKILDMMCGTGYVLAQLQARGYTIAGLDLSAGMLAHAQNAAPTAQLVQADATAFSATAFSDAPFDAVIQTSDSFNHLMEYAALQATFRNIAATLKPGGWFVFDMNGEERYRIGWNVRTAMVHDDFVATIRSTWNRAESLGTIYISMFTLAEGGLWRRDDAVLLQRHYSRLQVVDALRQAGFTDIHIYDGERDLGHTGNAGRTIYTCRLGS